MPRAIDQGRPPVTISLTNVIRGIVIAKKVEYSIDGLVCDLTLSPGMLDIETPITSDDIDEGEGGEGQQYPYERGLNAGLQESLTSIKQNV